MPNAILAANARYARACKPGALAAEKTAAAQNLAEAKIAKAIAAALATAPPLSPEQADRLASLLRSAPGAA